MNTNNPTNKEGNTTRWIKNMFARAAKNPDVAQPSTTKKNTATPRKEKTVLVVDDDHVFLKAATMRLESEGYDVITATEGSDAIQQARKNKPDLMVLDVELTRDVAGVPWDGFQVIEWMQRFDNLKNIPVVIASCGDASKYARKAFKSGATGFFHKSMDAEYLPKLVDYSLAHPRLVTAGTEVSFQI